MSNIRKKIPTNIITGFLGVGKTTAITHLLRNKPEGERWSVLVNEFGEIGIDGALLKDSGAFVREVPGGCICCVAGLPMKIALNMLIATTTPDRVLIEPTGLGHPEEIINTLTGDYYDTVLDLRATLTLLDPRKLRDPRYSENPSFNDQLAVADILVANKIDLCSAEDLALLDTWLAQQTDSKPCHRLTCGELDPLWLDTPRRAHALQHSGAHKSARLSLRPEPEALSAAVQLPEDEDFIRRENQGQGFYSCGWLFRRDWQFSFNGLFLWLAGLHLTRVKAVLNTDQGVHTFNCEEGVLSVKKLDDELAKDLLDSRIEFIDGNPLPVAELQVILLQLVNSGTSSSN